MEQIISNQEFENLSVIQPSKYFEILKDKKKTISDQDLVDSYNSALILAHKYSITGQEKSLKRLAFHVQAISKERDLVKLGFTTYVEREDIETYINEVADKSIKIIELKNYEREIPEEAVLALEKVKNIFDQFYIIYTDYSRKEQRKIAKEKQDKDPILFGVFQNSESKFILDRFYFIADWVDPYCDLTLDKLVKQFSREKDFNPLHSFNTPITVDELTTLVAGLTENGSSYKMLPQQEIDSIRNKQGIFTKIRAFFGV